MMVGNAQAENSLKGVINKVDPENGFIIINDIQYRIKHKKTKVFLGDKLIDFGMLQQGMTVKYVPNSDLITEIRLIKPIGLRD